MKYKVFMENKKKFSNFLDKNFLNLQQRGEVETSGYICVVVQPWVGTAVPWFAIVLALLLQIYHKQRIIILFDDLCFGDDESFFEFQKCAIEEILQKISYRVRFDKLSDYYNGSCKIDEKLIETISNMNSIHKIKGETDKEKRLTYQNKIKKQYISIYQSQSNYLDDIKPKKIIVPGGIWGSSGLLTKLAQKRSVQVMSYDSGEGVLLFSTKGIASQLTDIKISFEAILKSDDKSFAIQKGKEQLAKRKSGNDLYSHFDDEENVVRQEDFYLILLNSVWDSAALGLHAVYENMIDWILDTIEWILKNTQRTVFVRQHPAERDTRLDNTDNYEQRILFLYGTNKRVVFISAQNTVNTYSLIEKSLAVVGFSSTSIVEAVALEKPAIIVSNAYFSNFGITYHAKTLEEYYEYLKKADLGLLNVSKVMNERAFICNYVTQTCNWIKTVFTPIPNDFEKWVTEFNVSDTALIIQAILNDIPVSWLQHKRLKKYEI